MAVGGEQDVQLRASNRSPVNGAPVAAGPNAPTRRGAIPSLDGIRAIAVLIVVASHSGYGDTIPGGLGVTVFFFLSGFLITTLLLDEHDHTGSIHVPHFYLRRAYRLLPPLVVALAIAYILVAVDRLAGGMTWSGLASQLFYFANYFQIFHATPTTQPEGTGILWSLAVEEHFYLLFPIVIFLALRFSVARRTLVATFVVVCGATLTWRLWLVAHDAVELRTYYATDTRFDSILFGCVLALWRNPARSPGNRQRPSMRSADWLLVTAGGALLLATIVYRDPEFRESLRYTLQGLALMPLFFYAISYPASGPFRILNTRLMARIGVLSYGIYLTHDIVLHALSHNVDVPIPPWARFSFAVIVSGLFAIMVDRYVDPYFRRRRAALH